MSGFALPSFRWLLAGAVAAGIWVAWQESGKPVPKMPVGAIEQFLDDEPPAQVAFRLPDRVATPPQRPDMIVTGAVTRPKASVESLLRTTTRVNLRQRASLDSAIVAKLDEGQTVKSLAASGEWRLVSVDGRKGWIHVQYLGRLKSDATRKIAVEPEHKAQPKRKAEFTDREADLEPELGAVPEKEFVPQRKFLSEFRIEPKANVGLTVRIERAERRSPIGRVPARAPQGGDCQCPYDVMLNGSPCGDHSAYVLKGPDYAQCYF
jgi:uncharacterized protein YgiM (DUF1202 family)